MRRLVFERRIPFYKLGPGRRSPLRFERADLDRFLQAHRHNADRWHDYATNST
jgi:hypothetical protein